jgi:molecular chaperone DnaJ
MTDPHRPGGGRDPYSTLGVGADASEEEITRAYRRLARAQHPDANPHAADGDFAGLTDAYDVLRDPDRRRRYDQTRDTRAAAARAAASTRIPVRTIRPDSRPRTSGDRTGAASASEVDLELTFDQAALGTTATVTLPGEARCPACDGRGVILAASGCADCGGAGATSRRSGGISIRTSCASCQGTGQGQPGGCTACDGRGTATTSREITVRVPAGVEDGSRLRLQPRGGPGAVDAVVRVAAHPFFGRRGLDVTIRLPVTLAEAALGAVVTVPTLDGAVTIRVPAGTSHGRVLRVAGRGVVSTARLGDLLVTVAVDVPAELNDRQRVALEAYAAATGSPRRHLEGRRRAGSTEHPNEGQGGGP